MGAKGSLVVIAMKDPIRAISSTVVRRVCAMVHAVRTESVRPDGTRLFAVGEKALR